MNHLELSGLYHCQHIRDNNVIDEWSTSNIIVDQGLNTIINVSLGSADYRIAVNNLNRPLSYVGIFSNDYTPVSTDTIATFPNVGVAGEVTTGILNTVRPIWVPTFFLNSKTLGSNASPATFVFTANTTVNGAFLVQEFALGSNAAGMQVLGSVGVPQGGPGPTPKGGLISAAKFATTRNFISGDALTVVYSISLTSS